MDPYISSEVALDVEKTLFPVKPSLLMGGSALKLPWGRQKAHVRTLTSAALRSSTRRTSSRPRSGASSSTR